MSVCELTFRSKALDYDTPVTVILPNNGPFEDIPTLYLLHGMHGNHSSWLRRTSIERYAEAHHCAVVCPDGAVWFYTDMAFGANHFSYVADELVEYTRRVFRLSHDREKTFIAGLSMGGYGAVKIALRRPETFAAAASLSGCLDMTARLKRKEENPQIQAIWGLNYYDTIEGSDSDLFALLRNFPEDKPHPRIYAACGTSDSLYGDNIAFCKVIREEIARRGFSEDDFCYEEGPGAHTWDFWDKWIRPAMDYMMGAQ